MKYLLKQKRWNYWVPLLALTVLFGLPSFGNAEVEEGRVRNEVWSGYWWPTARGEILAPLAKYDLLTGKKAATWEKSTNPPGNNVPKWFGLCHASAAAAILEAEPRRPLKSGNQTLSVGDQKGWLAVCHSDDVANFYGDRFGDGIGSENPMDIAPDELWLVLRRHIKEQGVSIVLDLEPGPEVWNYPAFAYKIEHKPIQENSRLHRGTMSIWFADSGVPKDFVGQKRVFQRYHFEVEMQDASIVMGTGKWIGESVKNHPDFVWFPYVVRSANPEMDYLTACKLLGRKPVATPPETPVVLPSPRPVVPVTEEIANISVSKMNDTLTLPQLLLLLEGEKSDFVFDISAGHFDGKYAENDLLVVNGISDETGYLYLFGMDPNGKLSVLYPQPGDDNRIEAKKQFTVPSEGSSYRWRLTPPHGDYRIRGIMTQKPLHFSGEYAKPDKPEQTIVPVVLGWDELLMRILPTEHEMASEKLGKAKGGDLVETSRLQEWLGRFAQDEVLIYVAPTPVTSKKNQH